MAKRRSPLLMFLFAVVIMVGLCIAIGSILGGTVEGIVGGTGSSTDQSENATPAPTKEISDITYYSILNKYNTLTDVQWKEYVRSINGERVHWVGIINDVAENDFLGSVSYQVNICMNSYPCVQDVWFTLSKEASLQLNKGQEITFEGDIESSGMEKTDTYLYRVIIHLENPYIVP